MTKAKPKQGPISRVFASVRKILRVGKKSQ
jgi:hypothetical protein